MKLYVEKRKVDRTNSMTANFCLTYGLDPNRLGPNRHTLSDLQGLRGVLSAIQEAKEKGQLRWEREIRAMIGKDLRIDPERLEVCALFTEGPCPSIVKVHEGTEDENLAVRRWLLRQGHYPIMCSPNDFIAMGTEGIVAIDCSSERAKERAILLGAKLPVVFPAHEYPGFVREDK